MIHDMYIHAVNIMHRTSTIVIFFILYPQMHTDPRYLDCIMLADA